MKLVNVCGILFNPDMIVGIDFPKIAYPDTGRMILHMANGSRIAVDSYQQLKQAAMKDQFMNIVYNDWKDKYEESNPSYGDYLYDMYGD